MRLTPIAISVAIAVATMASAGKGQRPDDQVDPRSVELVRESQALLAAGQHDPAIDLLESALALDPRNRQAFIALARVAQSRNLPGKAIRYYGQALQLEPNDVSALAGQGEALVQRGAIERAKRNLEKIRTSCKDPCPQAMSLAAAIAKGPPAVATAQAATPATPEPQKQN